MFPARRLASLATSLILAAGIATGICKASSIDHLYEGFRNPPMSARPDVYWWWNGNAVEKTELLRELDVLKRAGIGGVLIFPMAPTMGAVKTSARELPWLSPEWSDALKATIEGARKRGMNVDLLVGTGWPFGGSFLKPGEQIQKVKVVEKELEGPGTFKGNIKDLMVPPGGAYSETTNGLEPKLLFMRLVQKNPDSLKQTVDLTDRVSPDGSVEFRNVSFRYDNTSRDDILHSVNLNIKSGETIGIIGSTGSAKTTLAQLIPRLYDVSDGTVLVGGQDVRHYSLVVLRDTVAMVLQKNTLFSGTIRENLKWGKEDATDEEIKEACEAAQAWAFISEMPGGLDTDLSQGGLNLSGGQKQRLCIARALLKKPRILILDDSTSAVDMATDARIRASFSTGLQGITTLIIAQRISSIEHADRVIVIDDGKINAVGTNDELLKANEIYRDVYNAQKEGAIAG
jgi:ABC-type methionine transport system ATPase subunit